MTKRERDVKQLAGRYKHQTAIVLEPWRPDYVKPHWIDGLDDDARDVVREVLDDVPPSYVRQDPAGVVWARVFEDDAARNRQPFDDGTAPGWYVRDFFDHRRVFACGRETGDAGAAKADAIMREHFGMVLADEIRGVFRRPGDALQDEVEASGWEE